MTYEELLDKVEMLKFFNQRAGRELWNEKPADVQNKDIENADKIFSEVQEVVKRLIPMKPESQYENGCNNAFCPACKGYVGIIGTSKGGRQYCAWCGQRIDWEEE